MFTLEVVTVAANAICEECGHQDEPTAVLVISLRATASFTYETHRTTAHVKFSEIQYTTNRQPSLTQTSIHPT